MVAAVADSGHVQAKRAARRARAQLIEPEQLQHGLLVDAAGIPLAWTVTGGNRNNVAQLVPLVERVPPVRGTVSRPPQRPERVTADRGYDHGSTRANHARSVEPEIARRQTEHGSGSAGPLGRRAHLRLAAARKTLLVRYDPATKCTKPPRPRLLPRLLQEATAVILRQVLTWSKRSRGAARSMGCPLGLEQRSARSSDGG